MNRTIALATLLLAAPVFATSVVIDAAHDRRPISPQIYGLIGGDEAQLNRMGVTVRRHGGNSLSRFNWLASTTNSGGDGLYFQKEAVESADDFVAHAKTAGAQAMIELPLLGYVSAPMAQGPEHCGFSLSKYGPQRSVDPSDPSCGDGFSPDGGPLSADPLDTSLAVDETWSAQWVTHLVNTFGPGGVSYYNLGNQPALWNQTHRDVHPAPASYAEITDKLAAYGSAVKAADPSALTLGPAAWGWLAYFDSAAGDRAITQVDFIPYYLRAAATGEAKTGHRLLDYLDVHIYPQATGISAGAHSEDDDAMRIRSTRILWDPAYVVESWESCCYGGILRILPRMHEWIDANYPGTRLAVSAYGFGAIDLPNGALTEADVLGIFGREGVDLATLDGAPVPGSIGEDAFRLYRNYDGQGSRFGDTSIRATSASTQLLESFAAFDASGRVTVVLINADPHWADEASLTFLDVGLTGPYRVFEFGASGKLEATGSGALTDGTLVRTVAPATAMLIEFTPDGGIGPAAVDLPDAGTSDAGLPDAGSPDAGTTSSRTTSGCSATGGNGVWLLALIGAWLLIRRPPQRAAVVVLAPPPP